MAVAGNQSGATPEDRAETPACPLPKRRRRVAHHVVRHTRRFVVLSTLASVGFCIAFAVLVALAVSNRPVALPHWVTRAIETQMNRGVTAGRITLDRIEVQLQGLHAPQVELRNVGLYDDSGIEVARLNEVGAGFDLRGLIEGHVMPHRLRLSGAQITVRRRRDGSFDLSFGAQGGPTGSVAAILDRIDRMFTDGPLAPIESIDATDLTITLEDARVARIWQVTGGHLTLDQTDQAIEIAVGFDVFNGTDELAKTTMTFRSLKGTPEAQIAATFSNAASRDIALQSPVLAFLGVLDAPISGSLRLAIGPDSSLSDFAGTLKIGEGALTPGPGAESILFDRGRAYFTYDPQDHRIDFSELSVESDAAAVQLSGATWLRDLGEDGWPGSFVGQYKLVRLMARADRWLPEPIELKNGEVDLKLALDPFRLTLGRMRVNEGDATVDLSGRAWLERAGLGLSLDFGVDHIAQDRLMALWPPAADPEDPRMAGRQRAVRRSEPGPRCLSPPARAAGPAEPGLRLRPRQRALHEHHAADQ